MRFPRAARMETPTHILRSETVPTQDMRPRAALRDPMAGVGEKEKERDRNLRAESCLDQAGTRNVLSA